MKDQHDKEKKSFKEEKEKLNAEKNELKISINKLIQDLNNLKNEKQRVESEFSRAQFDITKLQTDYQRTKRENDDLVRKHKYQENEINNFKVSRSYQPSPRNTDREDYQFSEEIKVLRQENESMKSAII